MYWNVTRTLLTLLLMLVLIPVQSLSATYHPVPDTSRSQTGLWLSDHFALSLVETLAETEIATHKVPKSENRVSQEVVAIFNHYRNGSAARKDIESDPNASYPETHHPSQSCLVYSLPLIHVNWKQRQTPFHHAASPHRLSGWKETNALYVALNSQFI